jgi:hypothetical protein
MHVEESALRRMFAAGGSKVTAGVPLTRLQKRVNALDKITDQNLESALSGDDLCLYQAVIHCLGEGERIEVVPSEAPPQEEVIDCSGEPPLGAAGDVDAEDKQEEGDDMSVREREVEKVEEVRKGRGTKNRPRRSEEPTPAKAKAKAKGAVQSPSRAKPATREVRRKVEEKAPAKASKVAATAAVKEKPKVKKEARKEPVGVVASIVEFLSRASAERPLTKARLVEKLAKRFPEKDPQSMRNTVNTQISTSLRVLKGIEVQRDGEGGFWIETDDE